jgi:RimJ/RimL family protein N-acetyltransferase
MAEGLIAVRLKAWTAADLDLLRQANSREMTAHLGGPESEEKLLDRHRRYLELTDPAFGRMFSVVLADGRRVANIGYWERAWQGEPVYETGWSVAPAFHGRGVATAAALAVIERVRAQHRHKYLHAFPAVGNAASNAVCRKAGFSWQGKIDFEYPKGTVSPHNDWRLDL